MLRVGLMGGTFNPIHLGHLRVAEEARVAAGLDEILFIPNRVAPHRSDLDTMAPARDRYLMTCMAVSGHERFRVSSMELDRPTVSYTVETVEALRREHPDREFTFLTGADSLLRARWHRLDDLLGLLACFLVVSRPGHERAELEAHLDGLGLSHRDRIAWLEIPGIDLSSTEIRARIREGRAFRYLVPEPVYDYLWKNGLYTRPFPPEVPAPAGRNREGRLQE